ncbi:DUF907 domain protein [Xylona heveae TC161]|uniref:DUF907 domain protein n=1 Tax=Xylona heveae (strain CBS 132557 / TC161) TaxID=1328760 RepID=A0A165A8P4_XYLHT|nr:DUF907 domain protein [Xylona heveae TC161]KZF20101.1 DUF907 domain protein [Xylona heveae TC161]
MRLFNTPVLSLLAVGILPVRVLAGDVLKTSGFTSCLSDSDITVEKMNVQYDRSANVVTFDVAGSSAKTQNVTASLSISAYGKQVYQKEFNPCDANTHVEQLCPVPVGNFAASGSQDIPSQYADMIPAIAFQIPDLDGAAKLQLSPVDGGNDLACIQSTVTNGKSAQVPAVPYIAAGVAGAAFVLSGLSAAGAAAGGAGVGAPTMSPSFVEVMGWFQSMAMNGMHSVNYPSVYRSFASNFGFSGGLISWNSMQVSIDTFRQRTGGNLTEDNVSYLKNATLIFSDSSSSSSSSSKTRRGLELLRDGISLAARGVTTNVNGTQTSANGGTSNSSDSDNSPMHLVHGVQGYVEQLTIPQANTFMTVLLVFCIIIAAITVGILLLKVILEAWALFGTFPKKLTSFRKRYWWLLAKTITNLILLLYGMWVLYCIYQFTHGDSWAAKLLAAVTLLIFTAVLGFFTSRIWILARRYRKAQGDAGKLFEDKETWRKYSLFYDQYRKGLWWLFIPSILYMFAKGCVLAAGDGHGLSQTVAQLIIESLMLGLLIWCRPYQRASGNWINIFIQIVRVLSVACILLFVEELGFSQSTKTITGVVLIAVQSVLTGTLAILIAVNAIINCCRENPHRKRRKAAEKLNRDLDDLTPLDARNSLLIDPNSYTDSSQLKAPMVSSYPLSSKRRSGYTPLAGRDKTPSSEHLAASAAAFGKVESHQSDTSDGVPQSRGAPLGQYPSHYQDTQYRGVAL